MIDTVLMVLAIASFAIEVARSVGIIPGGRINWVALGLLFWALTVLV